MSRRSPAGGPLLLLLAVVFLPEVIKKCKPLAKTVGDVLVKAGEQFQKAAAEPDKPIAEVVTEPAAAVEDSEPAPEPVLEAHEEPKGESDPVAEV